MHRQYVVRWFSRVRCCARARGGCGAYLAVGDSGGGLLLAEALHGLGGHFERLWLVRARSWEVRAVDLTFERLRGRGQSESWRVENRVGASAACGLAARAFGTQRHRRRACDTVVSLIVRLPSWISTAQPRPLLLTMIDLIV